MGQVQAPAWDKTLCRGDTVIALSNNGPHIRDQMIKDRAMYQCDKTIQTCSTVSVSFISFYKF